MPRRLLTLFLALFFILAWQNDTRAEGVKIAIFPLQDLSQGDDGVNWPLTDQLSHDLAEKGMEIVSRQAVVSFMVRHRIRTLGQLEAYYIRAAKKELDVKLILIGSVCQKKEQPGPALALVVYLLRTEDGKTTWANTADLCCADTRRLLGINEPKTIEDLYPLLISNILSSWPTDVKAQAKKLFSVDLESAWLRPTYLRSGHDAQCSVHLRSTWLPQNQPDVVLKIGEQLVPLTESTGTDYYEFSWKAAGPDGRYPVSLVTSWPDGHKQSLLLGSYFIDNKPPGLKLRLKGILINDKITFRNRLSIIPIMTDREPLNRWQITFKDGKGETLLSQDGSGIPPERLFWRGNAANGKPFPDGDYRIIMKIWDRAGNTAEDAQWVTVLRTKPEVSIKATLAGDEVIIDLGHTGQTPISYWRLNLRDKDGIGFAFKDGDLLPTTIHLPLSAENRQQKIKGSLMVRDVLGNQSQIKIDDLLSLAKQEDKDVTTPKDSNDAWVDEF
ncbi:MAG: hypothetical protein OEL66_00025 [Desulfobulbaceae bacterium]|nr:hypothetical protein [Desulfobulbaceae bacterium]